MTSISDRSKGFPIFIKVIIDSQSDATQIPPEFIRRLGHNLSNRIFLKLQNGRKLTEVELNRVNGQTLMQRGWLEFKQRLSLRFRHFLVFEYNGNSQFNVRICDTSAVEINYPSESDHEPDVLLKDLPRARKRKVKVEGQGNDVISIPGDKRSVKKSGFQTQNVPSCYKKGSKVESRNKKGPKTESLYPNTRSQRPVDCRVKRGDNHPVNKSLRTTRNVPSCRKKVPKVESSYPNTRSQRPVDCRVKREESGYHYGYCSVAVPGRRPPRGADMEMSIVYQSAVAFASRLNPHKTPFVIRLMQKSHVSYGFSMRMPFSIAGHSSLCVGANAITMVTKRKQWSVRCIVTDRCASLSCGWKGFANDNELKIGDVCIFQVVTKRNQQQEPVWNVIIFRA